MSSYRYGFNGKEKEGSDWNENYDFGARIYDPRIARWLSVDPKAVSFPSETAYSFAGNSPLYFTDPSGGFKVPIHKDITLLAYAYAMGHSSIAWAKEQFFGPDLAYGVGEHSDWFHPLDEGRHFDGMDFNAINNNWQGINKEIDNINIGWFNKSAGGWDVVQLGKSLHAVQDFYSHSNYVELYIEYYRKNNNDAMPAIGEIPTYDEVVENTEKYADFSNTYLKPRLHTGDFGGAGYVLDKEKDIQETHEKGKDHHDDLAKDDLSMGKKVTNSKGETLNTHTAARDVATRHSTKIIKKKLNE